VTWKELIKKTLEELGGEASLPEIYEKIEGHDKTVTNPTWQATIRRSIRQYNIFDPVGEERSGRYKLVKEEKIEFDEEHADAGDTQLNHGIIQGMLLLLGRIMGFETFCPKTDQTIRSFQNRSLSEIVTIRDLADAFAKSQIEKMREIDVVWLKEDNVGLYPKFAFEVEHTTKVKSGLERLIEIPERYGTYLYIIVPDEKEEKLFQRYMDREIFRRWRGRFSLKNYGSVEDSYNAAVNYKRALRNMEFER